VIKRTAVLLLAGAGLGLIASMWYGPALISWWWNPPGNSGVVQICGDQVSAATRSLVHFQLTVGAGLAVVFAVFGNWFAMRREASSAAKAGTITLAAPAPQSALPASTDLVPKP
jgi:hypothetical protein